MLASKGLYPVTILDVNKNLIDRLVMSGYVFCRDVVACGVEGLIKIGLKRGEAERILSDARSIVSSMI